MGFFIEEFVGDFMETRPIAVVVDDSKPFLMYLSLLLDRMNLEVLPVNNTAEAIEISRVTRPSLITMDMMMPGMDGLETLKRIKESHPDAEIIMLSGQGTVRTSIEAMKLGAEDFLEKPVDLQELLKKIDEMKTKRILVLEKQSMEEIEQILKRKAW